MHARLHVGLAAWLICAFFATTAEAGMGAPTLENVPDLIFADRPQHQTLDDVPSHSTLSKLARLRLNAISFFLVLVLASGWAVKLIWNSLAKDFPKLPRISYLRSLGLVALWGLLFVLVLTMISGARELMTPGAWRKKGLTYELVEPADQSPRQAPEPTASPTAPSEKEPW
jgi:hypothetical protein